MEVDNRLCRNCRWFMRRETPRGKSDTGECRIGPPTAFAFMLMPTSLPGLGSGAPQIQQLGVFPPTQGGNWCGAHEQPIEQLPVASSAGRLNSFFGNGGQVVDIKSEKPEDAA